MERRRRAQLQRVALLLGVALSGWACSASIPEASAEFKGEPMKPNEIHHAVQPCEEHMLAPARVQLEVAIDEHGEPLQARVSSLGGTVRQAFANCAHTRLMAEEYASRGKPVTIGAIVDLRVGAYSNAGAPTPIPPGY